MQETEIRSLGQEDPLEEKMANRSNHYSCLENPHGLRSLASYCPWGCRESDTAEWLSVHAGQLGSICPHLSRFRSTSFTWGLILLRGRALCYLPRCFLCSCPCEKQEEVFLQYLLWKTVGAPRTVSCGVFIPQACPHAASSALSVGFGLSFLAWFLQ